MREWIRGTVADWAGSFRIGRYGFCLLSGWTDGTSADDAPRAKQVVGNEKKKESNRIDRRT